MSGLLSLDELRPRRDPDEPTMGELEETRRELMRMFPRGYAMFGKRPEDPAEGDMYAEDDGQIMVYVGEEWKKLAVGVPSAPPAPLAMGGPVRSPWDPSTHTPLIPTFDPPVRDPEHTELLEVLLCPECDVELGARACGPQHAFLADNPMNHRLLKPLLERYQEEIRWGEGKQCSQCSVPLASSGCGHVDVRGDQVLMSRETYEELTTLGKR